jgi:hypothetical protein
MKNVVAGGILGFLIDQNIEQSRRRISQKEV